jgi:hypothetical protein
MSLIKVEMKTWVIWKEEETSKKKLIQIPISLQWLQMTSYGAEEMSYQIQFGHTSQLLDNLDHFHHRLLHN